MSMLLGHKLIVLPSMLNWLDFSMSSLYFGLFHRIWTENCCAWRRIWLTGCGVPLLLSTIWQPSVYAPFFLSDLMILETACLVHCRLRTICLGVRYSITSILSTSCSVFVNLKLTILIVNLFVNLFSI